MILRTTAATLLCLVGAACAHGSHEHGSEKTVDVKAEGYIRAHMANEHHIDSFDLPSFFMLHDLDNDGFWNREEIEAVYGVHHDWNPKDKDLAKIKIKADKVVERVLQLFDKDKDGRVSLAEFEALGFNGLPDLTELGAEGHHYDVESEFFLHHEELYHSTPETQTDEAYNHPEDDEHFANHQHIEAEEERRERKFQGLPADGKPVHAHDDHPAPSEFAKDTPAPAGESGKPTEPEGTAHPHNDGEIFQNDAGKAQEVVRERPKVTREDPPEKKNPVDRYRDARASAGTKPNWGDGEAGFQRPKTPADKMRRNVPYKYKFKRNWADF